MRFYDVGDFLEAWELLMSTFTHSLMIKYGLPDQPSEELAARWTRLVQQYIDQGLGREAAGHAAAKYLFVGYQTRVYASEADNIETLLRLAGGK